MPGAPSAQYSVTLRVEIDHRPGMLGKVASAIGAAGGTIGAVDIVQIQHEVTVRDIAVESGVAYSENGTQQAGMGLGLIPDRAFEVVGRGMGLCAVRLRDDWARRELKIVVRDRGQLSATGRLVLDHLRAADGEAHAVPA